MIKIKDSAESDDDDDSSIASFDGDLVIQKCSKSMMAVKKSAKKDESAKLDKSKAIKKDKSKSKKAKK